MDSAIIVSLLGHIGGDLVAEGAAGKGAGFVGSSYSRAATSTGRRYLAFNDEDTPESFPDNIGAITVTVEVGPARLPAPSSVWLLATGLAGLATRTRQRAGPLAPSAAAG